MISLERIEQMMADLTWEPWAEQGWTLHPTPDGQVMAVNVAEHRVIERAKRLEVLVSRLERGAFSYKEFLAFKKLYPP